MAHPELGRPQAIGVDDMQYGRGHRYLTLVCQIDAGLKRLLRVGQERTTASFQRFFDQWCKQVTRSQPEPMKKVARTLRNHRELLLNYFRARKQYPSDVIEELNNKSKVTMRKTYGLRIFRATEIALYHAPEKLAEPPAAHRFC